MNLKTLKAQLDAAAAELAKKPDDATLKAAHEAAKSTYDAALAAANEDDNASGENDGDEDSSTLDVTKLDPKVQKLIKDLRKENGDARKRNKNLDESQRKLKQSLIEAGIIEGDEENPEEKLKTVTSQNEIAVFNTAVLEAALDHGVGKADLKYFKFLVQEKLGSLEEGEELDDEAMAEIAKASKRTASGSGGSTSVSGGGSNDGIPPGPGGSDNVTLDQFTKMNMGEKSAFYLKHPDLYATFVAEAKSKRMLV